MLLHLRRFNSEMGRFKCQESLRRGLVKKQYTPVRMAPSARSSVVVRKRLLPNKRYEELSEEPQERQTNVLTVKPSNPVLTKPVNCELMRSPAFPKSPRGEAILPAGLANKRPCPHVSPAGHPTIQVTPDSEGFKGGEEGILETSGFSMESDITSSTDDDDDDDDDGRKEEEEEEEEEEEDDCYSSTASSSLPSPEIFRKESNVKIKNSTLLDVRHAENIDMHHPSKFAIDISVILPENNSEIKRPEAETKRHADLFQPDKPIKLKTPPEPSKRKPILYKKKVWFKSPITETFKGRHIPTIKLPVHNTCEPVQTSSPAEQVKPGTDASRAREINSKEQPLQKRCQETAKFFDFTDDHEEELFFRKMRERHVKLRNAALFPLPAV